MMVETTIDTLADLPFHVSGRYPKAALLRWCRAGAFDVYSSAAVFETIRDFSLGLTSLGVGSGDRVALLSESRPEWIIADQAILTSGAVTVPIYPNLPAAQVGYILRDAGVRVVIAADETQAAKVREEWTNLADVRTVIVVDADDHVSRGDRERTFEDVRATGHRRLMTENGLAREYKEAVAAIPSSQLATIIYTSGTTGDPKGVMLTHEAIVANVLDANTMISVFEEDEALSFLPLCHALERAVVYLYLLNGVTVTFAESFDTVARDLQRVRPTLMTGVPEGLRETPRSNSGDCGEGTGIPSSDFQLGAGGRPRLRRRGAGGTAAVVVPAASTAAGRPSRLFQDPGANWRAPPVCRFRRRTAVEDRGRVSLCHRDSGH